VTTIDICQFLGQRFKLGIVQFTRSSPKSFFFFALDSRPAKKPFQYPIQLMPSSFVLIFEFLKHEAVEKPLLLYINTRIHIFMLVKTDVLTDIKVYTIMCCPTGMGVTLA